MSKLLLALMVFSLFVLSSAYANKEEVIRSKEDIVFHTPDMFKFSNVGKISEFKGVINRVYFTTSDLKMVDLYQFKTDEVKVTPDLCMLFIEKIFSLKTSRLYSLKSMKIELSNKGNICEAHIADKNKVKEDPYTRIVTIGFINAKANVLVYHPSSIQDEKISEIRKFWNSLR